MEVFRKRALDGGGRLLHASTDKGWALKAILESPSHPKGTLLLNVWAEVLVLTVRPATSCTGRRNPRIGEGNHLT